jgi:hypothetical protein
MSRFVQSKVECDLQECISDCKSGDKELLRIAIVEFYAGVPVPMRCPHASRRWYTEGRRSPFSVVRSRRGTIRRERPMFGVGNVARARRNADMAEKCGSANDGSGRIVIALARCYIRVYYVKKGGDRPVVYSCTLW